MNFVLTIGCFVVHADWQPGNNIVSACSVVFMKNNEGRDLLTVKELLAQHRLASGKMDLDQVATGCSWKNIVEQGKVLHNYHLSYIYRDR